MQSLPFLRFVVLDIFGALFGYLLGVRCMKNTQNHKLRFYPNISFLFGHWQNDFYPLVPRARITKLMMKIMVNIKIMLMMMMMVILMKVMRKIPHKTHQYHGFCNKNVQFYGLSLCEKGPTNLGMGWLPTPFLGNAEKYLGDGLGICVVWAPFENTQRTPTSPHPPPWLSLLFNCSVERDTASEKKVQILIVFLFLAILGGWFGTSQLFHVKTFW